LACFADPAESIGRDFEACGPAPDVIKSTVIYSKKLAGVVRPPVQFAKFKERSLDPQGPEVAQP
jgi:hypothetical protein